MRSFVPFLLAFFGLFFFSMEDCLAQVCGCTDPLAINYNASATVNDGSCEYESVVIESTPVGMLDSLLDGTSTLFFWNNGYWTFNDHNDNCLYRIDPVDAAITETLCINEIGSRDMEEISQDSLYLYFGDIGNNSGSRQDLHILRISKESILNQTFVIDTIAFSYEDQTDFTAHPKATDFDCEAFVVTGDSIYLFTKQWLSHRSVCYALPKQPGDYVAERRFTLHTDGLVTDACFLHENRTLVLIGYSLVVKPFVFFIDHFDGARFDQGRHRRVSLANAFGNQMEGIATLDGIHFFITRETLSLRVHTRRASLSRLDLSGMPEESNVR